MKVAFFADILIEDFDGASRTMFQLIRRIPGRQFEFLFICGKGPATLFGFECLRVPAISVPFNSSYSMALPYLAKKLLDGRLSAFDPDIIHIATPSLLGNFAVNFAQLRQLPVLSIYHTHFISYVDYYLSKAPFLINFAKSELIAAQRSFYNKCDLIYVPSESIAVEIEEMGISQDRLKLWKRGIDTNLFSPQKRSATALSILTGNNNPNILFVSRLVWEKNLETLIRIYEHCQTENLNYNFIIAGDGIAKKACQLRMKKAFFTGSMQHAELSELYATADVFVFTSVSETYGNVVLEAMASGLPCVIADGGGSKDFIQQGVNGFKCEPEDHIAFTKKIQTVVESNTLKKQFSGIGRAYSLKHSWEELTAIYFEDLQHLTALHHN